MTGADTPSAGRFDGRVHLLPVRVYYEDTDFTGLVYHANYLRYLERGRSDFLRAAGIDHTALLAQDDPIAFAILRIALEFKRPARIDDALLVRTLYQSIRGARILIAQTVLKGDAILVEGEVEACCISLTGRPRRPPKAFLLQLTPLLDPARSSF